MINKIKNAIIKINDKIFHGSKLEINHVTVRNVTNSRVVINGVDVTPNDDSKIINISVEGNLESLVVDCCNSIEVNGDVKTLKSTSGDIDCRDITGEVKTTSGDISSATISGNVTTVSGDIDSKLINGNCKTLSGDIKYVSNK